MDLRAHLIHELKHGYGEYINYENVDPEVMHSWIGSSCREPLIVPVNFQIYHKAMARHVVKCLAKQRVRIHPKFDKLITALKSATVKDDEFSLDKGKSAFNDAFDSFRLSLLCLHSAGNYDLKTKGKKTIYVCECGVCTTLIHKFTQEDAHKFIEEHSKHYNSQMKLRFEIFQSW